MFNLRLGTFLKRQISLNIWIIDKIIDMQSSCYLF